MRAQDINTCVLLHLSFRSEDRLLRVLDEVNARDECLQHAGELIQRFRKATNR